MSLILLEEWTFNKKQGQPPQIAFSSSEPLEQAIYSTILVRNQINGLIGEKDRATMIYQRKGRYIELIKNSRLEGELVELLIASIEHYSFQINNSAEVDITEEKKLNKLLEGVVANPQFHRPQFWARIKGSLLLSTIYLEMHLKFLIIKKKIRPLEELNVIEKRTREVANTFSIAVFYCRKLFTILSHLKVYTLNANIKQSDRLIELLKVLIVDCNIKPQLATLDCRIMLLYNCLKIMLGVKQFTKLQEEALLGFYQAFGVKAVNKYEEHILHIFFIIKGLIFRKGQAMENGDQLEEEQQEEGRNDVLVEKFANWISINLEETSLALEEVSRNIIRHRVASLATLIGMKLSLPQFCLNFLELMHDGPFNNDAQTIKLCFQLFEAREYQKLHNSLQVLLSAASCKNLREREVLLSMCGIFTGLFLENREEALLYAKLNHSENKRLILREETLWQQVGFAYYNLAIHEGYICNRQNFISQALSCLLKSIEINANNYLAQYCVAKIYLMEFDYDLAYKHVMQSCKSGRGQWVPFSLLACVYFCQKRVNKASLIIEELIKKYSFNKLLHYIRAYLEVNRILLEVEYDEEVEAAKQLGDDIYELCREKILKSKSLANLVKYCQEYHQLSVGFIATDYDENYFNLLIASPEQNFMDSFREGVGYQQASGQQTLLQIIPLFLEVGLLNLGEGLLKMLPLSPLRSYYRAVLHQLKREQPQAMEEYRSILKQQPYHTQTLINLALIEPNPSEGLHYLDIAEKFVKNGKLWLAKGVLLSKLGRIQEATPLLLREGEQGWFDMQPDLLYYY